MTAGELRNHLTRTTMTASAVASILLPALCLAQVRPGQSGYGNESRYPTTMVCSSDDGSRVYCDADTRGGVRLVRRISGSGCEQGSTWGYDSRGIWVDRGCRAEFEVAGLGATRTGATGNAARPDPSTFTCASQDGRRVYCDVETRGGVRLVREMGASPCRQGATWGYDAHGVWVDGGCKAEFALTADGSIDAPATIPAGTDISIRTTERIESKNASRRVFRGVVDRDVSDASGRVSISRGSPAGLIVRYSPDRELVLSLDSVMVDGQRVTVATSAGDGGDDIEEEGRKVGNGRRAQVWRQGRRISVAAESVLSFRLEQAIDVESSRSGVSRSRRYRPQYR